MPVPPSKIKYSTAFTANAIKAKNFVIGSSVSTDYGPTSSTGYWNGITPPVGGYVIYINKASQGPSIFVASNDTDLINLTKYISGTNITSVNEAITWFAGQTDKICVNSDYYDIVTNGLVLNFDAGYTVSYPRSGVTWYDIGFSGYNATLLNSPSFALSGNGYINFTAASSQYATFSDLGNLSNFSCDVWTKQNSLPVSGSYPAFIANTFPGPAGNLLNYSIGYNKAPWDGKIYGGFFNGSWQLPSDGFTPTTDQWYHYSVTYDGSKILFYVDGAYFSSGSTSTAALTSGAGGRLMRRWDDVNYIDGNLLSAKVYNRALTSTEIRQNYNAHSLPVGSITSGLVLNYDAGNILSYPTTGTVWKNMAAPTTNNGILTNGPTFSSANYGSIVFDGTNDYVSGGTGNMGLDLSDKSFQCWIKTNTLGDYGIIDKDFDTAPGNYGGWGMWLTSGGKIWWWNHSNLDLIDTGALSVADATWTNVAVTWNATSKTASFYYNGVLSTALTNTNIVEISSGTQPVNIGCTRNASGFFFKGNMSLLLGYNRVLSASEILVNYNSSKYRYALIQDVTPNSVDWPDVFSYPSNPTTINQTITGINVPIQIDIPQSGGNDFNKQYSINDGAWVTYAFTSFTINNNDTLKFRGVPEELVFGGAAEFDVVNVTDNNTILDHVILSYDLT